jgi:hypothetical protein
MKKYIRIKSTGEIDEKAFYLIGASSKRGDSTKIGYYGSGLKYSLAFLLRNNTYFKVYSGYKEIKFTTNKEEFREKEFAVISVNGKPTSLTTDMGGIGSKNYFMVIRELFCNAIDEGDAEIKVMEVKDERELIPIEDCTTFYFESNEEFQKIIDNWNEYFSNERQDILYHDKNGNVLYTGGDKKIVYRKGILCHLSQQKSIFNYDLDWVTINESRIIEDDWNFNWKLKDFLKEIKDISIIKRILFSINNCWEKSLSWDSGIEKYSDVWKEALNGKTLIPQDNAGFWSEEIEYLKEKALVLPSDMINGLKQRFGDDIYVIGDGDVKGGNCEIKIVESLNKRQQFLLDESMDFLKQSEYAIKYPIKVCNFFKAERLGLAQDDTIFLSEKLFDLGKKYIVHAIIEENEHLLTGYADETREFQNLFIKKYISCLEDKTNIYL